MLGDNVTIEVKLINRVALEKVLDLLFEKEEELLSWTSNRNTRLIFLDIF